MKFTDEIDNIILHIGQLWKKAIDKSNEKEIKYNPIYSIIKKT